MPETMLGGGGSGFLLVERGDADASGSLTGPDLDEVTDSTPPLGIRVECPAEVDVEASLSRAADRAGYGLALDGERVRLRPGSDASSLEELAAGMAEEVGGEVELRTDPGAVEDLVGRSRVAGEDADTELRDGDVDAFYGCRMCQSVSPTHLCVVSPERPGNCGLTWSDLDVVHRANPDSGYVRIPKGERLGPGEHRGVNDALRRETDGAVEAVRLYDALENPHTTCGCRCYDAVVFYIPERDGFGVVHEGFDGETPLGLGYDELADRAGTGRPVPGMQGVSWGYLRSDRFLESNDGWSSVVWATPEVMRRVGDAPDVETPQ